MSVELNIVALWMLFPIGLACVASGRIGRALAQMRQGPGDPQALPRPGSTVVSSRVIDVSSPSASSVPATTSKRARDAHHVRAVAADQGQRAERSA